MTGEAYWSTADGMPTPAGAYVRGRVGWVAAHGALVGPRAGDTPRFVTMRWKAVLDARPGFAERGYSEFPTPPR